MDVVRRSVYIECPIDDVYDIALVDVEGLPDWMMSVKSVDQVDDNWPEVGSTHTYTGTVAGRTYAGRTTVTRADPPYEVEMREETYVSQVDGKPLTVGGSRWTFASQGTGTVFTIELSGSKHDLLSWLIWTLYGRRRTERQLERTLRNIKRLCEEEIAAEREESAPES